MSEKTKSARHALAAIRRAPWAIMPEALETICGVAARDLADISAAREIRDRKHRAVHRAVGTPLTERQLVTVRGGVAILPVTGPIFPHADLFSEMSGATSIETLALEFQASLDAANVEHILLDIDSPGGVVFGIAEFAEMLRTSAKPVTAYVSGLGASAAYWIATAAQDLVIHETALVGSIGVVMGYEVQESADRDGYRQFEMVSSNAANKRPDMTTEEGRAQVRAELDALEAVFIGAVALNRGVSPETVISDFAQGGIRVGADAVAANMADRLGTFEETLASLSAGNPAAFRGGTHLSSKGDHLMADKNNAPAAEATQPEITADYIKTTHPQVAAALIDEGVESGRQAAQAEAGIDSENAAKMAAEAERTRILGIEEHALPGHEKLVAEMKADGKTTPEQAAVRILQAEKQQGAAALQGRADADKDMANVQPAPSSTGDRTPPDTSTLSVEDKAKADWVKNEKGLQADFGGDFNAYLAECKVLAAKG